MDWWVLELITTAVLVAHRLLARAAHQAVREELRGRRVPGQPADRQELHRAHRRRLLPDLLRLHPVHGHFEPRDGWGETVNAEQLQHETARSAGSC